MTDLSVTVTSRQKLTSTDFIDLKVPKWNSATQQLSLVLSYFDTENLPLSLGIGYSIPCKS